MVQRRAARWVTGDWRQTSSVTRMSEELSWRSLAPSSCRRYAALICFSKLCTAWWLYQVSSIFPNLVAPPGDSPTYLILRSKLPVTILNTVPFPLTIVQWNALPPDIPAKLTLDGFKAAVCSIEHISPRKQTYALFYHLRFLPTGDRTRVARLAVQCFTNWATSSSSVICCSIR